MTSANELPSDELSLRRPHLRLAGVREFERRVTPLALATLDRLRNGGGARVELHRSFHSRRWRGPCVDEPDEHGAAEAPTREHQQKGHALREHGPVLARLPTHGSRRAPAPRRCLCQTFGRDELPTGARDITRPRAPHAEHGRTPRKHCPRKHA